MSESPPRPPSKSAREWFEIFAIGAITSLGAIVTTKIVDRTNRRQDGRLEQLLAMHHQQAEQIEYLHSLMKK